MFKATYLLLLLCSFGNISKSQNLQKSKYIVITFSENYKKSTHGIQDYFWVIPVDSISSFNSSLYPLYTSNYTKTQFNDCSNGISIDPSIPSIKPSDYDFDSLWYVKHDFLTNLINEKRKLVQTIKKIWSGGNEITIKIYATPIIGEFCSCNFAISGQQRFGYIGRIYLAHNFSENYGEFWNSQLANFILKQDYSGLNFKKIIYPSR